MFSWYKNAIECYVYLYDVPDKPFEESEWFTRGWTLQELIAPRKELFYDKAWALIGDKNNLSSKLQTITGVPVEILLRQARLSSCSIAERMSWASTRITTRIEDRAYSLLGIFSIHMPMLYGEGRASFRRLQEELMKRSNDITIFWWASQEDETSLLAPSPSAFHLNPIDHQKYILDPQHFTITNAGLSVELMLIPCACNIWAAVVGSNIVDDSLLLHCIFMRGPFSYKNRRMLRVRYNGESTIRFEWRLEDQSRFSVTDRPRDSSFDLVRDSRGRFHRASIQQCMIDVAPNTKYELRLHGIEIMFSGDTDVWGPTGRPETEDVHCVGEYDTASKTLDLKSHPGFGFVFGKICTHKKFGNDRNSICFAFDHDGTPVCLVSTVARTKNIDVSCASSTLESTIKDLGEEVHVYRSPAVSMGSTQHSIACLGLILDVRIHFTIHEGRELYVQQMRFAAGG
ncbi:hypothetical protein H2198_001751 [Neophaeococcomyces mojaviensis]|uniref:Uncharacterized protein n=1 Tax=Neophaeococcomyces mojaviensis TaxID=3383035 RepID=A0ACC3AGL9_9EURO|nr:hypothetical protein H2198_001751 [Knufia sp. JES_112]